MTILKAIQNSEAIRCIFVRIVLTVDLAHPELRPARRLRQMALLHLVICSLVPEQHNCGGPPTDQTQGRAHAWLQAFRHGSDHDLWDRAGSEDQEATVQNRKSTEKTEVDAWNLGGRSGGLKLKPLSPGELNRRAKRCTRALSLSSDLNGDVDVGPT